MRHLRMVDATLWVAGVFGGLAVAGALAETAGWLAVLDRVHAALCLVVALAVLTRVLVQAAYGHVTSLARGGAVDFRTRPFLFVVMVLSYTALLFALIVVLCRFLLVDS